MGRKAVGKLLIAAVLAGLVVMGPGVADAGVAVKTGLYKGKTTQQAVTDSFRTIERNAGSSASGSSRWRRSGRASASASATPS